ncbi:hypothetical protein GC098_02985 [Paenibacillus sp. LMG 31458]|uniref:Lipoprotein n=1 Tax=Paenibacillus phytorum TaxID=2654977 RepID=A0ABX1XPT8_9BACL|nr:hypothetical protein [Paenibacillus phytorum]NOU70409.1 hypothetical protein [Paenibacillus phytorum]
MMRTWIATILIVILISMLITSCSKQQTVTEQVQENVAESLSVSEQTVVLFGDGNKIQINDSLVVGKIMNDIKAMTFTKVEGPDTVGQNFTLMFSSDKKYSSTGYFVINKVFYKATDAKLASEINKYVLDYGRSIMPQLLPGV